MGEGAIDLPAGWRRDENGALKREVVHSMLRRLTGWDYKGQAIYQITVTLADRAGDPLGRLEVRRKGGEWQSAAAARGLGLKPGEIEARVALTPDGEAVSAALDDMPRIEPRVAILARQIMPDHCHFILFARAPLDRPIGQLVRGFKAGAAKRWKNLRENAQAQNGRENAQGPSWAQGPGGARGPGLGERAQWPSGAQGPGGRALGLGVGGSAVPARFRVGMPAWSAGFQDTVLLHDGQLANMRHYLADNPRRLAIKRLFPGLFRAVRDLALDLPPGRAHFAALGNAFLLDRPLAQVQVSRRDFAYRRVPKPGGGLKIARDAKGEPLIDFATPIFAEKQEQLLAAARHGSVLVSPCVSDGERQIAHAALAAGLPLVTMQNKGFSPLHKPAGRYFDACAAGRLLMLAPAGWPHQPGEKPMTRVDATAMNRLCQWIVGADAADINYHGMKPVAIDACAREAARIAD